MIDVSQLARDPYPSYAELRASDPVHRDEVTRAWLLTRHADVNTVLRSAGWSSDHRTSPDHQAWIAEMGAPPAVDELLSKVLLFMDAPDHTRLRNLVNKAFTPRRVERLRPRIEQVLTELLEPLRDGAEFDVIADLAFPFPVTVMCELLGVPAEDREMFRARTRQLAVILEWQRTPEDFMGAAEATFVFAGYFLPLFEERRRNPRDDLVSALVAAEDEGDRLSADELFTTCVLLLAAGHETTMNLIANGLLALLRHPDQLARLRDEPSLARSAVEEVLRYDSPVQLTARTALVDQTIGDKTIRAGEQAITLIGAANRDPEVFENPDTVDIGRDPNHHLAFGGGAHFCLGAALARAEAQIALPELVRLPGLQLAVDEPAWRNTTTLRGLQSLPVRTG